MNNKVLVAIDGTGLPPLVVASLSAQISPSQTEVLVPQVVEPLIFSVPPEMASWLCSGNGYPAERELRAREKDLGGGCGDLA